MENTLSLEEIGDRLNTDELREHHSRKFKHLKTLSNLDKNRIHMTLKQLSKYDPMPNLDQFTKNFTKLSRKMKVYHLKKSTFRAEYDNLVKIGKLEKRVDIRNGLRTKGMKSDSGIVSVTVFTSPYPNGQSFSCKHNCYFCPDHPEQPRSYLPDEPGCIRGARCAFGAIQQMWERISTLVTNGHDVEKVELLVLGGTWTEYPVEYQEEFIRDLFFAANTFDLIPERFQGDDDELYYQIRNRIKVPLSLEEEQHINESSSIKIIGLTLETRPDTIDETNIRLFKKYGCTRMQLGIQSLDNKVLKKINRGHTIERAYEAMEMLLDSGYKVDIHLMPDLPGSTVENDQKMFDTLLQREYVRPVTVSYVLAGLIAIMAIYSALIVKWYHPHLNSIPLNWYWLVLSIAIVITGALMCRVRSSNHYKYRVWDKLQADQWKIYPCTVTPWSIIEQWYKRGKYIPYAETSPDDLTNLILSAKKKMFPWIRLNRVVRDIPHSDRDGNRVIIDKDRCTNLRQVLQARMKAEGWNCPCIRCREVGLNLKKSESHKYCPRMLVRQYNASRGDEYFISYESSVDHLYGFCRLRLSTNSGANIYPSLKNTALVRELHVYGKMQTTVSKTTDKSQQHCGYGTQMMKKAENIAMANGFKKIAVIAGVGTRNYYAKLGYTLDLSNHMIKELV